MSLCAVITTVNFYQTAVLALLSTVLMFFASFKFVQTLQQSGYDGKGYLVWLRRKDNIYMVRLLVVALLSLLAYLAFSVAAVMFIQREWITYVGFVFYVAATTVYIKKDRSIKSKQPLVKTARIRRLLITFSILSFFITLLYLTTVNALIGLVNHGALIYKLRYGLLCLSPIILPFVVLLSFYVNEPFERYNNRSYVKKCKSALSERPDLIKIGITGSYGKTSVKEILYTILSEKFSVLATPYSYNTPLGICRTVRRLTPSHEVLIAEMGARNVGDIKELVDIVHPTYAILTGITNQHVETFGSIDNVKKTKLELIDGLPEDGFAVYSVDSPETCDAMRGKSVKSIGAGLDKSKTPRVYAEGIRVSGSGTKFTLVCSGERAECTTVLIGKHNVSNICLAVGVALELGLTLSEICSGINKIKPIRHRLEIINNDQGYVIIDDTFNANVNGTIAAMDVLDCFEGRKIVITPGLVELGRIEEQENLMLGKRLSKHADMVILVGKRRVDSIREGLLKEGFPEESIVSVKSLDEAVASYRSMARAGDVIMFENDLPDKYN